jgi:serine-aspartate repeat-containing protein C/D/E
MNYNGLQDAGEAGIKGVTVKLLNSVGTVVATATTDANGNYLFSNLAPATTRCRW